MVRQHLGRPCRQRGRETHSTQGVKFVVSCVVCDSDLVAVAPCRWFVGSRIATAPTATTYLISLNADMSSERLDIEPAAGTRAGRTVGLFPPAIVDTGLGFSSVVLYVLLSESDVLTFL